MGTSIRPAPCSSVIYRVCVYVRQLAKSKRKRRTSVVVLHHGNSEIVMEIAWVFSLLKALLIARLPSTYMYVTLWLALHILYLTLVLTAGQKPPEGYKCPGGYSRQYGIKVW